MTLLKFARKNLLYLLMLSFVLIVSCGLVLGGVVEIERKNSDKTNGNLSDLPTLKKGIPFPIISAQAVLATDVDSGVVLFEKDPDKKLLPASTTKIITAMVTMDFFPMDKIITVGNVNIIGQKMNLVKGEQMTVKDLLYGLLVYSANDAAEVLAANYLGGRDSFIYAMNQKAKELHLDNTYFTNPSGLDGESHYSTARDLIRASEIAMENPLFAEIVGTKEKTVASENGKIIHKLTNINELLGGVDGVMGVKTGWTEEARENLVTYINKDKKRILIAILGSQDRFGETKELIDWTFDNYEWEKVSYPL
jgi:D-alanyl-D-alanine carboxypeptidase